jgi:hypothetical protein
MDSFRPGVVTGCIAHADCLYGRVVSAAPWLPGRMGCRFDSGEVSCVWADELDAEMVRESGLLMPSL